MFNISPACLIFRVSEISSVLGWRAPDGWLCKTAIAQEDDLKSFNVINIVPVREQQLINLF